VINFVMLTWCCGSMSVSIKYIFYIFLYILQHTVLLMCTFQI